MKHIQKFNEEIESEGFGDKLKRWGKNIDDKMSKFAFGENMEMPLLDNTTKKYTEQDLFEATEEAFQNGYIAAPDSPQMDPRRVRRPNLLNVHKKWFLDFYKVPNFKKST